MQLKRYIKNETKEEELEPSQELFNDKKVSFILYKMCIDTTFPATVYSIDAILLCLI